VEKETIGASPKRILCVEDDADSREILNVVFAAYTIVFAESLRVAHPLIEAEHFDLYMLDNWLPDGSGVELCREIRALKPGSPIIFTSAVGTKPEVDEAIAAGANHYFLKPIELHLLERVVKELLAKGGD